MYALHTLTMVSKVVSHNNAFVMYRFLITFLSFVLILWREVVRTGRTGELARTSVGAVPRAPHPLLSATGLSEYST